jgi:hypothetical protein
VLAIDPGHTTGVAILDETGCLEVAMTVTSHKLFLDSKWLYRCYDLAHMGIERPVVVIERPPQKEVDAITTAIYQHLVHWFDSRDITLHQVMPGSWKGLTQRIAVPGQHARDAATMGRWFIEQANYLAK